MPAANHACSSSQLAPVQRTVSIPPRAAAVVPAVPRRGRWLAPERVPQHAAAAASAGASRAGASPAAELDVDVCILGAGIIGLCTALALLRSDPRLSVALLDRQAPCAGATGAGQGYLWLAHRDVGSPLFRLAAHSRDMWRQLLAPLVPELTTAAVEWQEVGSMLLASTTEEAAGLAARCEALAAVGLTAQLLTAAEARRLEPALQLPAAGAALRLPSDLQVNGRATAAALLRACQACGGRFTPLFGEGALRLATGGSGRVERVHTEARRVRATRGIVVALGAWSGAFLAQQLADVRWAGAFRPRRGLLLEMPAPAGMPAVGHGLMEVSYTSHYSPAAGGSVSSSRSASSSGSTAGSKGGNGGGEGDGGFFPLTYEAVAESQAAGLAASAAAAAAPSATAQAAAEAQEEDEEVVITFTATTSASGSLLVGSSREFAGYSMDAPEQTVSAIMQRATHFLPAMAAVPRRDIGVRAGPRPFATTGAPTVSPVPGVEGLLVAAGHEGSGLTMAPATAELVAAYLLERPSSLDEGVVEALRCPFGLSIEDYLSM